MAVKSYINYTPSRLIFLWVYFYFFIGNIYAQNDSISNINNEFNDTVATTLQEVEIIGNVNSGILKGGSFNLETEDLIQGNRILGEADAINFLKRLSGVTTGGDYGSGVQIDGFASSQSVFRINEIPVFFPYRFGGLFSTFNSSYFDLMNFERGFHSAKMPNRLGAKIDFNSSKEVHEKIKGTINIGMLSSSLALSCPIGSSFQVSIGGRISYIDNLYGSFFKGSTNLSYRFADLNANLLWKINKANKISAEFFFNKDKLQYFDDNYAMKTLLNWSNNLFSLAWLHSSNIECNNRIYFTCFDNSLGLALPQFSIKSPSNIKAMGVSGDFSQWFKGYTVRLDYGYEFNIYKDAPQSVMTEGLENGNQRILKPENSYEARVYGDFKLPSLKNLKISGGISFSYFNNHDSYQSFNIDPRINLSYLFPKGSLNLHLGRYSQYLHQIGFSQIGLASDFWMVASKEVPTQNSYDIELDYSAIFGNLSFSITGYLRRINAEPDYIGQVLNLLDNDYNPINYIHVFNGYNCGINLMSKLSLEKLTGILGMGYGIARRKDGELKEWVRGKTEPGFTLNMDVNYKFNSHWQCGAQFRLASGRPYTPILSMYLIAGNVIKEFGEPNSALFPLSHHLDLSATWSCETKVKRMTLRHFVNLSIINAYGHKNVEIMTYVFNPQTGDIALKKVYSLYRFLPSLSYTLEF